MGFLWGKGFNGMFYLKCNGFIGFYYWNLNLMELCRFMILILVWLLKVLFVLKKRMLWIFICGRIGIFNLVLKMSCLLLFMVKFDNLVLGFLIFVIGNLGFRLLCWKFCTLKMLFMKKCLKMGILLFLLLIIYLMVLLSLRIMF